MLRSEIPSGICAKLRTVAASNNRVHIPWSLYYCLFAPHICMVLFFTHIPFVVNHTINATPPERLQQLQGSSVDPMVWWKALNMWRVNFKYYTMRAHLGRRLKVYTIYSLFCNGRTTVEWTCWRYRNSRDRGTQIAQATTQWKKNLRSTSVQVGNIRSLKCSIAWLDSQNKKFAPILIIT